MEVGGVLPKGVLIYKGSLILPTFVPPLKPPMAAFRCLGVRFQVSLGFWAMSGPKYLPIVVFFLGGGLLIIIIIINIILIIIILV